MHKKVLILQVELVIIYFIFFQSMDLKNVAIITFNTSPSPSRGFLEFEKEGEGLFCFKLDSFTCTDVEIHPKCLGFLLFILSCLFFH